MNNAETVRHVYEKAWENYRRDVRLGLMPDAPFHKSDEQLSYIEEALCYDYETEDPGDREFHLPVRVEEPYAEDSGG